jgi:stress-induced morphogen
MISRLDFIQCSICVFLVLYDTSFRHDKQDNSSAQCGMLYHLRAYIKSAAFKNVDYIYRSMIFVDFARLFTS